MREGAYATSRRVPLVVVRGGRVVDETAERDADVVISDGRIVAVGENLDVAGGATVLEAHGCIVCPGLVDLHAHLREPGGEDAESVETGARAASLGGFTAVVAMPNTDPPIDNAAVATEVMSLGARATCRVDVAGAITVGRMGERLAPLAELYALGVRIFTDDGSAVQDAGVMRRALEYAKGLDHRAVRAVLAQHCEVEALSAGGAMNEGIWSSLLGVPGSPVEAEELMVERDIALAALTGGRVHFMHLSSARSAGLVESAKARGLAVSAEVTPHHLALSDERLRSFDPLYKVNPPLRTPEGRDGPAAGLRPGHGRRRGHRPRSTSDALEGRAARTGVLRHARARDRAGGGHGFVVPRGTNVRAPRSTTPATLARRRSRRAGSAHGHRLRAAHARGA